MRNARADGTAPGGGRRVGADARDPDPPADGLTPQVRQAAWDGGPWGRWNLTRTDAVCLAAYLLASAYRIAVIPLIPSLVGTHPVLLEALQGGIPSLVAAGAFARVGRAALWAALAAPLIGLTFGDPLTWWAGKRFGRRILDHYAGRGERSRRRIERAERLFRRWGPWILVIENYQPLPNGLLYLIAGATGMPLGRFLAFDLVGAALWIVPVVALGYVVGSRAVAVAATVSHYGVWITAVWIAALVGYMVLMRWRRRTRPAG